MHYYRARWYDSNLGRFISEDPIRFRGSSNWYSYVENSPLNFTDPFGLYAIVFFDRANGTIKVWDLDIKPDTAREPDFQLSGIFSGTGNCTNKAECETKENEGPIPEGGYRIGGKTDEPRHPGWWRLYRRLSDDVNSSDYFAYDSNYAPIKDKTTGKVTYRGGFYLHPGRLSLGCVTFPLSLRAEYEKMSEILKRTSKLDFKDKSSGKTMKSSGSLIVF